MSSVKVPQWLRGMPMAPEFRPTDTEFADPMAYISKIEKEASAFGICKIIPPLPKPSKKYVFDNLNRSLLKSPELGDDDYVLKKGEVIGKRGIDGGVMAVFTTRQQELGQSAKRGNGMGEGNLEMSARKQVWQSGEAYTLDQFENKSKAFAKNLLGVTREVDPLVIEALFWKTASGKAIYVEYANDVPGSGFREPEGRFHYFQRRKMRVSHQSFCKHKQRYGCWVNDFNNGKAFNTCRPPSLSSKESLRSSKRNAVNGCHVVENFAGWKLSNSPWNLQLIARSPGSLTRFMPDDIPGVTSPMVYLGMLFSWFAWHVEDHELHSMNFLHTGSPKTWYAVPGDCAVAFEEAVRTKAYGNNVNRLTALTLLGEKTTLLSPETLVSYGIPCCRLVQSSGEFVVTFPRAYHVGFSHGFNCGEAANFGTSQWLKVAKEAAVRRAAMNYLPMLSHQQLLYLLTMSFESRVPRSLLPVIRNSRLRNRQKVEREASVRKAFIKDILEENHFLSVILGRNAAYRIVLWNPDLLPSSNKESQSSCLDAKLHAHAMEEEHVLDHSCRHDRECENKTNLLEEMSLYVGTMNDLYTEADDLSSDFQVDTGILACVACGILGFPFMAVVQPCEIACRKFMRSGSENVSDNCSTLCDHAAQQDVSISKGWNTSCKFLRPYFFCLEHSIQVEELLRNKGGTNILVICHSDFIKIKAQAEGIARELDTPFNYNEVLLEDSTKEDLNLVRIAIENDELDGFTEDWTSRMGVNLQHYVKIGKNFPSKQIQHALAPDGLFVDNRPVISDLLNTKWRAKGFRSRTKPKGPARSSNNDSDFFVNCENGVKEAKVIIQYSRRRNKTCDNLISAGLIKPEICSSHAESQQEAKQTNFTVLERESGTTKLKKMKIKTELIEEDASTCNRFVRSPCEGLRPRIGIELRNRNEIKIQAIPKA